MYTVIRDFSDSTDNKFVYRVGDVFPRSGLKVSEERLTQLLGDGNKQGVPLIRESSPKPEKATLDKDPGVDPPKSPEPKKRQRKKHA